MPFQSKRQQRAAFGGYIPGISKEKAKEWAKETPSFKALPDRAPAEKGKATLRTKKSSAGLAALLGRTSQKSIDAHFAKLADLMMGMGSGVGQLGGQPSSSDKTVWDVPVNPTNARGSGFQTPPRPKKPGNTVKKQTVNPRKNLRDAMSQGIA